MTVAELGFHRLANIFPMMDEAALGELATDIAAHGLRETIKLWEGEILDGRNRYAACQFAGVEPVFKALEFPGGEQQALAYVLSRNLQRRHLSVPQRSLVAGKGREHAACETTESRTFGKFAEGLPRRSRRHAQRQRPQREGRQGRTWQWRARSRRRDGERRDQPPQGGPDSAA